MKFKEKMLLLYAVTDQAWVGKQTLLEQIEDALKGGATIVQLREKKRDEESFVEEAIQVRDLCRKYNVPLIINDNVDVALKSGADGVHVGVEDAPVAEIRKRVPADFIIGATCKTVEQAKIAEAAGADYMGVGAVFPSPTKTNAVRITNEQLREIVADERENAVNMLALMNRTPVLGFEAANHYYFSRGNVVEKIVNCKDIIRRL